MPPVPYVSGLQQILKQEFEHQIKQENESQIEWKFANGIKQKSEPESEKLNHKPGYVHQQKLNCGCALGHNQTREQAQYCREFAKRTVIVMRILAERAQQRLEEYIEKRMELRRLAKNPAEAEKHRLKILVYEQEKQNWNSALLIIISRILDNHYKCHPIRHDDTTVCTPGGEGAGETFLELYNLPGQYNPEFPFHLLFGDKAS